MLPHRQDVEIAETPGLPESGLSLSLVAALSSDPIEPDAGDARRRWITWAAFLALAFLVHFAVLYFVPLGWMSANRVAPAPVEVRQVDPRKLEAIKRQWRNQRRQQQLLLNKDKTKPIPAPPPPDARYMSDRNRRVEREQRARDTAILPKPGAPQGAEKPAPRAAQPPRPPGQSQAPSTSKNFRLHRVPSLGNLGVPLHLDRPARPAPAPAPLNPAERPANQPRGGDQSVQDPNLPQGSENLLNTQESVYYSFYARMYETIGPMWETGLHGVGFRRNNIQPGDYSTIVDVVMDRAGNVIGVRLLQSSGIPEFDQVVDQAWKRAGQFPNPPAGLLDANGEVHTGWNFTVKVGGAALQFLPPSRQY